MSERVTIAIPDDMYQRVQKIAKLREQEIEAVLLESIVLVEPDKSLIEEDVTMEREEIAFRKMHPRLRQKYHGQYVAIYQEKLIDHDPDQVALYLRVKERHPDEFVWISPVGNGPEETYIMRSPHLVEKI